MKLLFIAFILTRAAALTRFFKDMNFILVFTIGGHGTGMTTTLIHTYLKQQRHRQRLHASAQS